MLLDCITTSLLEQISWFKTGFSFPISWKSPAHPEGAIFPKLLVTKDQK